MPTPGSPGSARWRSVLITLLALGFVARLTLRSVPVELEGLHPGFGCLLGCGNESTRDLLSNILLFLPLGWAMRHWFRPLPALLACFLATAGIETLQATIITGRDSSLRDIISNLIGGAIGIWLFRHWRAVLLPPPRRTRALAGAALCLWLGTLAVSAAGFQPATSRERLYGQWTAELAYYDRYRGDLLGVDYLGWTPPSDSIPETAPLREGMRRDTFLLDLRVVSGPMTERLAPIFSVADSLGQEQLLIGQRRKALWLRLRTRFDDWEFRSLTIRLPVLPGWRAGDTVNIRGGRELRTLLLHAKSGSEEAEVRVPETVGLGWTSMLWFRLPISTEWMVVNPLWLAGLIFPTGFFLGRSAPGPGLAATLLVLLIGLGVIPLVGHAAATTTQEWLGAAAGAVLACAAGAGTRRRMAPAAPEI